VEYKHTNLPQISKRKLNLNNGQDNTTIWVAYEGRVYDETESRLWQNGKYYEHWAGQDLTQNLAGDPDGLSTFKYIQLNRNIKEIISVTDNYKPLKLDLL
jgi:predicted heme/steroid binding protein